MGGREQVGALLIVPCFISLTNLIRYSKEIADLAENPTAPDINKLERDYDDLRRLLLSAGQPVDTVMEMLELIKMSTRIRPPYHTRTVVLVKILRFLDEESLRTRASSIQRHALKGYGPLLSPEI